MSALSPEDFLLIEKHLVRKLSDEESVLFRKKLSSDAVFRDEVSAYEEAMDAIRIAGRQDVKAILADEERRIREKNKSRLNILRGTLPKAAGVLLIIVFSMALYTWFSKPRLDKDMVFQESNKEAFPNYWVGERIVMRSGDAEANDENAEDAYYKRTLGNQFATVDKAMKAYNAEKYADAAALLANIDVPKDSFYFYRANAFFQVGNHQSAIADFERTLSLRPQSQELVNVSKWFLALSHLKLGNVDKSEAILKEVSASSTLLMKNRADELLRKMHKK